MKKFIFLLVCLFSVCLLFACKKDDDYVSKKVKENGEIIIVTSPDYAPFEFIDTTKKGQEQYVGADIELMKFIASEMDVNLKIEIADFDSVLALLESGVADIAISGFTYQPARAENYEMSNPYDSEGSQGVIIKVSDVSKYPNLDAINALGSEYKVVAQNGSLQADYVKQFLDKVTLEPCTKIADGVTLLENDNSIVAMAISSTAAESVITANPGKYVYLEDTFNVDEKDTQLFVIAQKGQTKIIEEVNAIIEKVVSEKKYTSWMEEAKKLQESLGLE